MTMIEVLTLVLWAVVIAHLIGTGVLLVLMALAPPKTHRACPVPLERRRYRELVDREM